MVGVLEAEEDGTTDDDNALEPVTSVNERDHGKLGVPGRLVC
jgi:hypothetical protein